MSTFHTVRSLELEETLFALLYGISLRRYGFLKLPKTDSENILWETVVNFDEAAHHPAGNLLQELFAQNFVGKSVPVHLVENAYSLNDYLLREDFGSLFDALLYGVLNSRTRKGGEYLLPREVTSFLSSLVKRDTTYLNSLVTDARETTVYNPFAGFASFGIGALQFHSFYGQELNQRVFDFSRLRADAHNLLSLNDNFMLERTNVNSAWPDREQFDVIISSPPLGGKIDRKEWEGFRKIKYYLIRKSIDSLKPGGRAMLLLPTSILSEGGRGLELRQELIDKRLLDAVILFPKQTLYHTPIPMAALLFRGPNEPTEEVQLVTLSPGWTNHGSEIKRYLEVRTDNLLRDDKEEVYCRITRVRTPDIVANRHDLRPALYTVEKGAVQLKKLLRKTGEPVRDKTLRVEVVRVDDLCADNQRDYLYQRRGVYAFGRPVGAPLIPPIGVEVRMISEPALLVARIGSSLKPTYFNPTSRLPSILIGRHVGAYTVDTEKINVAFLIHTLRSSKVKQQIAGLTMDTSLPRLRPSDFMRMSIELPPLAAQSSWVEARMEGTEEARAELAAQLERIERLLEEQRKSFADLKHAMGRPHANILSGARLLKKYILSLDEPYASINTDYGKFVNRDKTLVNVLDKIISENSFVNKLLEVGESGLQLSDYPLDTVDIQKVVDLIHTLSDQDNRFKLVVTDHFKDEWNLQYIWCNLDLLYILLQNLLSNADKHAFKHFEEGNVVEITLDLMLKPNVSYTELIVSVRNNGEPFPEGYTQNEFVQQYSRRNTAPGHGIGGYQIDRIAKHFGCSDWRIKLDKEAIYPVEFVFNFAISHVNAEGLQQFDKLFNNLPLENLDDV